jgi:aspartyl-tRNA(Asn)/glutamyl-tRNA(Gln) amidotransferase subunit B
MEYRPIIGLEIHAELATASKMFCSCQNDPDEKQPNINICPICMAHPGTLPVINKEAVKQVLRVGLALGGTLANFTEFDRKNYFYPDIPKGYQISQYKFPLVSGGELLGVKLTRIHLEEDTARSQHIEAPRFDLKDAPRSNLGGSLIDFNRAGVPLMELVTEPVITSAKQAADFARELRLVLRYLGVAEANMEKGEMRVEANVSVAKISRSNLGILGTKTEVKNINSFRAVEKAIEFEIKRQIAVLENGEKVIQETRGWDENLGATFSQRKKESSHDYRYFPDPDLPKLWLKKISEFQNLGETIPELPSQKRERLQKLKIQDQDVEAYVSNPELAGFFDHVVAELQEPKLIKLASNYIANDLVKLLAGDHDLLQRLYVGFPDFIKLVAFGEVSSRGAKDILAEMVRTGTPARTIAESKNLFQQSNEGTLTEIIKKIIEANPKSVADFKAGKDAALQFLVGQGMKESKGSANPAVLKKLFVDFFKK